MKSICLLSILAAAGIATAGTIYNITDPGTLGGSNAEAFGLNSSGTIVSSVNVELDSMTCSDSSSCSLTDANGAAEATSSTFSPAGLSVFVSASTGSNGPGGDGVATANIEYEQPELFTDGVGQGVATLVISSCISGLYGGNGDMSVQFGSSTSSFYTGCTVGLGTGAPPATLTTAFTYGDPFLLTVSLSAEASGGILDEADDTLVQAEIISVADPISTPEAPTYWTSLFGTTAVAVLLAHRFHLRGSRRE